MRSQLLKAPLRQRLAPPRRIVQHQPRANSSSTPPRPPVKAAESSTNASTASAGAGKAAAGAAPASIWMRMGPLTQIASAFGRAQKKRPYIVQTVSAIVIFVAADVSAQNIGGSEYDPVRTARTTFIGAVFAIPQYRWFFVLARYFNYKSKALSIAAKVVFNQLTFAVAFPTYFFGMQALLSGESLAGTIQRLQDTVPRSWQNSWKVWPAAMTFNLALVPLEYRALFSGIIAIGWQTYLSWMNRQAELKETAENDAVQEKEIQVAPIAAAVAAYPEPHPCDEVNGPTKEIKIWDTVHSLLLSALYPRALDGEQPLLRNGVPASEAGTSAEDGPPPEGHRDAAVLLLIKLGRSPNERIYVSPKDDSRVLRRIDWALLPLMLSVYFLQALDKATLSYASIFGLIQDANLVGHQFSWLGSIVFLAQLVMQLPLALALVKLPIGKFTGAMVLGWGLTLTAMTWASTFSQLMAARFFLGAFEASVGPSFIAITQM